MAEDMPTGSYLRRKRDDGYRKTYPHPCSAASIEWLAYVEREEQVAIQHARNGSEYRVGERKIAVDGLCKYVLFLTTIIISYFKLLEYLH